MITRGTNSHLRLWWHRVGILSKPTLMTHGVPPSLCFPSSPFFCFFVFFSFILFFASSNIFVCRVGAAEYLRVLLQFFRLFSSFVSSASCRYHRSQFAASWYYRQLLRLNSTETDHHKGISRLLLDRTRLMNDKLRLAITFHPLVKLIHEWFSKVGFIEQYNRNQ